MDSEVRGLIERIHATPPRLVLAVTGGGTGAAHWLLGVPGASRTILEAIVPYHEQALVDFLGQTPSSFCSRATARAMAERARERARWLSSETPVLGVACTASLRTDRPKRGDHRFHLAIASSATTKTLSLTLSKEARTREEEEDLLDRILLNFLAEELGLDDRVSIDVLQGERIRTDDAEPESPLRQFFGGRLTHVRIGRDGHTSPEPAVPGLILAGSFNPLHRGHTSMLEVASEMLGVPGEFELTVQNADKPPICEEEVLRRVRLMQWRYAVWLTRAPTFVEKARLFPGAVFLVGADTAARLIQPRFYGGEQAMLASFEELGGLGCRFLVSGRKSDSGEFVELDDIPILKACRNLFSAIPEERFRRDISSTAIREGRKNDASQS